MPGILQDLRFAVRMLAKSPAFTAVVVVTLALGIGANTTIFTLANSVLFRPAPYEEPDRLIAIHTYNLDYPLYRRNPSAPDDLLDWRDKTDLFSEFGYFHANRPFNLSRSEMEPQRVIGGRASASLFETLRVKPVIGRSFLPEEDKVGAAPVALLTHQFWVLHFGADPSVVGSDIRLDGAPHQIVGVLPADFHVARPDPQIWIPFDQEGAVVASGREVTWLYVMARLASDVTIEKAQASLEIITANLRETYPETNERRGVYVEPLSESLVWRDKTSLTMLLSASGFVLLIACANVANLLLGRLSVRSQEVAIRTAVGAGRSRLFRQFLTEALLLAIGGGAAGVLTAAAVKRGFLNLFMEMNLMAVNPSGLPAYLQETPLDARVLGFALLATLGTGLLFGVLPAFVQSQSQVTTQMAHSGRVAGKRGFLRNSLVVTQTALSMALLVAVGVVADGFLRAQRADMGFDIGRLSLAQVDLPRNEYATMTGRSPTGRSMWTISPRVDAVRQDLTRRIEGVPAVSSVASSAQAPPVCCRGVQLEIPEAIDSAPDRKFALYQSVSHTFFETLGIRLTRGRAFTATDGGTVSIVSESFALKYFGEENPLGKTVKLVGAIAESSAQTTIIGVVADSRLSPFQGDNVRYMVYVPNQGQPQVVAGNERDGRLMLSLWIRTPGDPASVLSAAQAAVQEAMPDQPLARLATIEGLISEVIAPSRLYSQLLGGLSLLAIALTAVGLYGVVSYQVQQRHREFGVRLALGEDRGALLRSVLRRGWQLTLYGIAAGAIGAYGLTKLMESQLFLGDGSRAPTFLAMGGVLLFVAAIAGYLPARRAASLDPIRVLRYE